MANGNGSANVSSISGVKMGHFMTLRYLVFQEVLRIYRNHKKRSHFTNNLTQPNFLSFRILNLFIFKLGDRECRFG